MPRPGFVLEVDRSTPPIMFWRGENFSLEKLPAGRSRVIYPPEPLEALERHRRRDSRRVAEPARSGPAARAAVPRDEADDRVRRRQLAAAEDAPPDIRQRVIEAVLDLRRRGRRRRRAHHRRARPAPTHARVRDAPRARRSHLRRVPSARHAVPARRRGPRQPHGDRHHRPRARCSRSTSGPPTATSSSTSTSTRSRWMAAGRASPPGLPSYRSLSFHHNPETLQNTTQPDGSPQERTAQERVAPRQDPARQRAEDLPDRDRR